VLEDETANSEPSAFKSSASVGHEEPSPEATLAAPPERGAEVISALMVKVSPAAIPEM